MSHFDPIAHFQHELEVGRQAEAYLMVGGSAPHLREVGEACAKAFLGARNALEDHPDYVVFDPEDEYTLVDTGGYIPNGFSDFLIEGISAFDERKSN